MTDGVTGWASRDAWRTERRRTWPPRSRPASVGVDDLDTPQAGDDRAVDDDVVAPQMRQHGDTRNLFDEVAGARSAGTRSAA